MINRFESEIFLSRDFSKMTVQKKIPFLKSESEYTRYRPKAPTSCFPDLKQLFFEY
jgi:hypothetical protein